MADQQLILGIDLGGTDCKFGLVTAQGRVLEKAKFPTESERGPNGVIELIAQHTEEVLAGRKIMAIGMGVPGPMNSREGIVYEAPNLPGWENVPVRDKLQRLVGVPVNLANDANAAAFGEFWVGAGREVDNMILFTLGTGIGGGIVLNNQLYTGPDDTAGELGHLIIDFNGPLCGCGNHGCLEAFASATAIRRMVREALAAGVKTSILLPEGAEDDFGAKVVYDAAVAGDAFALDVFEKVGRCLGIGAACMINALNPEMIVYSGAMSNAGDFIFKPLLKAAEEFSFAKPFSRCQIGRAMLGSDAGIIGAAGLALKQLIPG